MEKCADSDYPQNQYDSSKSSETWTDLLSNNTTRSQQKNTSKEPPKVSRARKKIAAENRSLGRTDPGKEFANTRGDKSVREISIGVKKLNVLKSRLMSARHSVQNNTKILHRNVPDRLGKYVNSSVRPETKLLLGESIAKPANDCSQGNGAKSGTKGSDFGYLSNICPDTKLDMIGNECLSNKESVTLGNSIESDSGSKNIFEKIFDDCLGSTSVVNDASSRETLNLEADDESVAINPKTFEKYTRLLENFENFKKDDARMVDNEKTPAKKDLGQQQLHAVPSAPVKLKDHSNYYSHKKIRHVCGYCHKIFKSNGKLNSHVYSHTGERPFDCNNCGKAFSSKFKLVRHLLIHSEIRKFVCQICDRTFLRNDHLKNHYKIHDPQKKMYKCPKEHCDKEYSSIMSHKKHMAYHNVEDGDLKCLICNVKFETKEEVLFHLKSHSGSRLFKSQSDKKFKCDFCERLFLTRKDVTRHLVVHTGERDFLCQFCPQRFGRKDHLVRHIKKSHVSEGMTVKNEVVEEKRIEFGRVKPPSPIPTSSKPEEKEREEESAVEEGDRKTHIVITVKNPIPKKKWKPSDSSSRSKSFRKSDLTVPNRKQVPLSKNKSSTTQIFLQNIPNILIIPNNSIILLRNQGSSSKTKKAAETSESANSSVHSMSNSVSAPTEPTDNMDRFQFPDDFMSGPRPNLYDSSPPLESDYNYNLNYNYNMFQPQPFPVGFPYGDAFGSFQPEMTSFDNFNFEMLAQSSHGAKRSEPASMEPDGGGLLPGESTSRMPEPQADMHRKVGIVKPMTKTLLAGDSPCDMEKDLFEEGSENLMMNDSILNDFKVDDSVILPLDNDGGILNNIFGQGGVDATGNELLRNLLMGESSILSPLPGFSQIFHNSNTN